MNRYKYQIFSDISEWIMYDFSAFIDSVPDESNVTIEITSHGGLVFYGNAIFQKIQEAQRRGVEFNARVYGLAASSAADIVLACDRIGMASTAAIMIHSAWSSDGEADEGIDVANAAQLAVIRRRLPEYSNDDLKADRWFRANEAKNIGLIDYIFDLEADSLQARLCAKYLSVIGGVNMEEEKKEEQKEEMQEAKKAEIDDPEKDEQSPSLEEAIERMIERVESIEKRLEMLEEAKGECGDRRDNARLKSLLDRISAVSKPCVSGDSVLQKETEDPKAALESYKAKYPNIDRLIDVE